jgi:hypothetical protein
MSKFKVNLTFVSATFVQMHRPIQHLKFPQHPGTLKNHLHHDL